MESATKRTLTEALGEIGFTHRPAGANYRHEVVDALGDVAFTGTANDVWRWLHQSEAA